MAEQRTAQIQKRLTSLLILEGYTEQVFYPLLRDQFFKNIRIELRNIKGQGNINKDILSEIYKYTYNNPCDLVRAYCCIDAKEQERSATPFDLSEIHQRARERKMVQVLSIKEILANPEVESWFFHDIEGIYKFLGTKVSQRNPKKYSNTRNLCKKDLERLFHMSGKEYLPGKRAENFINNLDIAKIVSGCQELREGIALIKSQADNLTNHLFGS